MPSTRSSAWGSTHGPLAESFELLLLDLDGVVYIGPHAVVGAAESLARATAEGLRCRYVTNNAARPPAVVAEHLRGLGIEATDDEVVTSAQEGAELLAERLPAGSQVLAVGGPGVAAALVEVGLVPVASYAAGVDGVLQGYGPEVGWRDLAEASYAVVGGATWVATNPDLTVPTPRGTAPGNGQLTAVVARTTGVEPTVTGKPGPGLFRTAVRRAGGGRALVIGDRLDTDIAGAVQAGLESLLVLTGVSGLADLLRATPAERPTYLAADLGGLWADHPAVEQVEGRWMCGRSWAWVQGGRLEVGLEAGPGQGIRESAPEDAATGDAATGDAATGDAATGDGATEGVAGVGTATGEGVDLDAWRAACAAAWDAVDGGKPVDLSRALAELAPPAR